MCAPCIRSPFAGHTLSILGVVYPVKKQTEYSQCRSPYGTDG
ncbi:hypothetical protein ECL_03708 [Enterobacter cloacae subsp. cloacae ATCC 13047]|uniref:Uncharacterized protein n=1 Tax=Enterobacter cloacae subsp. cloacae (strain ATCC 13047 / DSM 30054 / NBRC 13535 / NCTC 10005 / WDCM 00083 / NCDC 279-56) TaxID=716541 RepID=A0A0H3CRT5_ENTCC|nr:hypothetical protein ECL_03708 [Enterobacter cloacae subsp. cloacae ATCC 13047]